MIILLIIIITIFHPPRLSIVEESEASPFHKKLGKSQWGTYTCQPSIIVIVINVIVILILNSEIIKMTIITIS